MQGPSTTVEVESVVSLCPMYKVIMHNDPTTTVDFVIHVLMTIFKLSSEKSVELTILIHNTGLALVGVYPLEHAEFKVDQTHSLARAQKFPLTCTIEKA